MRRVREILLLKFEAHLSGREVARRSGMGETTVREMLKRFEATGLDWPLSASVTDAELEQRLYGRAATRQGQRRRSEPDWAAIHRELKKKHV
ncbi:IS21 family transposase, partial [Asticcacaulis sp. W401b]